MVKALALNAPLLEPPLLKRIEPLTALALPVLMKVTAKVVVPAPADFRKVPELLKIDPAPPPTPQAKSFWIVKLPALLKVAF